MKPPFINFDAWIGAWATNMTATCLQGGVFILLLCLVCMACRRIPASARGSLWWLACLKLLVGLAWPVAFAATLLPPSVPLLAAPDRLVAHAPAVRPAAIPASVPPIPHSTPAAKRAPLSQVLVVVTPDPPLPAPFQLERPALTETLFVIWALGLIITSTGIVRETCRARNMVRTARPCTDENILAAASALARDLGLRRPPVLLMSSAASGPVLIGLWRPVIVLPERGTIALAPDEIRMTLSHELAHLRRCDPWLALVPSLVSMLFWFFPLAWLACREFAVSREEDCDARTLRLTRRPAAEYGRMMLRFLDCSRGRNAGIAFGATQYATRRRLTMLEQNSLMPGRPLRRAIVALFALAVIGLVPWRVNAEVDPTDHPLDGNPLLDRKVSVHAEGLPLEELLTLLEQKTGVSLAARSDIKDEKLIIHTPPRPFKGLLADVAVLLNAEWRHYKTEKGKDYYFLARSDKANVNEARLAGALMARIRVQLDAQAQALDETPEQRAARPENDPIRKNLADADTLLATRFYAALSPEQRDTLFQNSTFTLPFSRLPGSLQEAARQTFTKQQADLQKYKDEHPNELVVFGKPEDLDRHGIRFEVAKYFGGIHITTLPGDIASYSSQMQWLFPPHGNPYTGKALPPDAAVPDAKAIREAQAAKDWPDRLRKLAELSGKSVIADYYRAKMITRPYEGQEGNAKDSEGVHSLDVLCFTPGYLWWTQGDTLLFRKRDWATQRQYEAPDSWLLSLSKRLKAQQNVPSYHDVFSLAKLTTPQLVGISSLKYRDEPPGQLTAGEMDERDLAGVQELLTLAQYAWPDNATVLPTEQYADRDGPDLAVLNLPTLNASQQQLLGSYLEERTTVFNPASGADLFLRLHCSGLPLPSNPGFHAGWSDVDLSLSQQKRHPGAGELFHGTFYRFSLPLDLPDDRRDKTKIELLP